MDAPGAAARRGRLPQLLKYEVLEEIGHGGMATVYRARDQRLARDVAVKIIHPHLRDSPEVAHRFSVEAKAVAKLRHANIVEVYDVSSEDEPEQYLVVELLRGVTLRKLLQRHGALPVEVAAALALELLHALGHAHGAGVIHRDVKPENVILEHRPAPPLSVSPSDAGVDELRAAEPRSGPSVSVPPSSADSAGERITVKLTDFGIAKLLDAQGVTSTGQVLGSPAHMAPEQIEGGEVDARADVFGLGVLLYECMVGHLPFEGNNPAQVLRRVLEGLYPPAESERPQVGKAFSAILDRALAHDANERFPDAATMREALLAELRRLGITSPRGEIEAWLDDPEAYVEGHAQKMIARLCDRAGEARKRGDALGAAADYNRALAFAPHDPQLMKIVAGMNRAESRARVLRQGLRVVVGMVALGGAAFFLTRALRPTIAPDAPAPTATRSAAEVPPPTAASVATAAVPSAIPPDGAALTPGPSAAPLVSTATRATAVPSAPSSSAAGVVHTHREVILASVRPMFGVLASLDGQGTFEVSDGKRIAIDGKAHSLHFTCRDDICKPADQGIVAGEESVTVSVALTVRSATLLVQGDSQASYQILELPTIPVRAGAPVKIPMTKGNVAVNIIQLPSGLKRSTTIYAGRESVVTFLSE